jgi:hypothetical protein
MPLLSTVLEKIPGLKHRALADLDSVEEGRRLPLTDAMKSQIRKNFPDVDESRLEASTFERRPTSFAGAKYDLAVYDGEGKLRFQGRAFETSMNFWTP